MYLENFPYKEGDNIYLRHPTWHYVGKITKVNAAGGWIELFPAAHILQTDNAQDFYQYGLRGRDQDGCDIYEVSPVPLHLSLSPHFPWSATLYLHEVPTVDYEVSTP